MDTVLLDSYEVSHIKNEGMIGQKQTRINLKDKSVRKADAGSRLYLELFEETKAR